MHQLRDDSLSSVVSWAHFTLLVPLAQPGSGHCLFPTFLAQSIHHSSIKVYLSGVRTLHIEQGFPDPLQDCLRLQCVIRAIKRCQGSVTATRLPITNRIMVTIWKSLDLDQPDHCMFWVACTMGYFGFLRSAEFTVSSLSNFCPSIHLTVKDIAVDSMVLPSCLRIKIKSSKTDPFCKGCYVHIGLGSLPLCAVHAMMAYLAVKGDVPGLLFLPCNGQPLSRARLTDWLRQILHSAGLEGNFSSHSFRIGTATVAAQNGVPDHLIQALGRWQSSAYQSYIRTPSEVLAALLSSLSH